MLWPAQTPEVNIIDDIWYRIKRELKHHSERLTSAAQLETAIRVIWKKGSGFIYPELICIHPQKTTKRDKVQGSHNQV